MTFLFTGAVLALQLAASSAPAVQTVQPLAPSAHVQLRPDVFGAPTSVAQAVRDLQNDGTTPGSGNDRVVCGLTILPADPQMDPGFVHRREQDVSFPVRRMSTGLCRDAAARTGNGR